MDNKNNTKNNNNISSNSSNIQEQHNHQEMTKIAKQPGWRMRTSLAQLNNQQRQATPTTPSTTTDKDNNNNNNNSSNNNNNANNANNISAPSGGAKEPSSSCTTTSATTAPTNRSNYTNPFNIKNLFALSSYNSSSTSSSATKGIQPKLPAEGGSGGSGGSDQVPLLDQEQNFMLDRIKSDTSVSSNGPLKDFILQQPSHIKHNPRIHFKIDDTLAKQALEVSNKLSEMSVREPSLTSLNSARLVPTVYHSENNKLYFKSKPTLKSCPLDRLGGFRLNSSLNIKVFQRSKSVEDDQCDDPTRKSRSPEDFLAAGTKGGLAHFRSSVDSEKIRKSQTSLKSVKSGIKSKTKYKIKLKTKSNCHSIRIVPQRLSPPSTSTTTATAAITQAVTQPGEDSSNEGSNSPKLSRTPSPTLSPTKAPSSPITSLSASSSNSNNSNCSSVTPTSATTTPPTSESSSSSTSTSLSFSALMDKFGFNNNANNKTK